MQQTPVNEYHWHSFNKASLGHTPNCLWWRKILVAFDAWARSGNPTFTSVQHKEQVFNQFKPALSLLSYAVLLSLVSLNAPLGCNLFPHFFNSIRFLVVLFAFWNESQVVCNSEYQVCFMISYVGFSRWKDSEIGDSMLFLLFFVCPDQEKS